MKRFGPIVLALALIISGCAQKKGQPVAQPSRLDALEADFSRFQIEQRARDADIDHKLGDIASRLDRLAPAQPPAAKGRKGKEAVSVTVAGVRQPVVAGQVVPYGALAGGKATEVPQAQPIAPQGQAAPGQVQPVTPQGQAARAQVQPIAPQTQAAPGQAQSMAPNAPAAAPAPRALPALNPPVVTLAEPARTSQPVPAKPRQPVPLETTRQGKGKATPHQPKPVAAQPEPVPAPAAPAVSSAAPVEMAPAIPSMTPPAAPAAAAAPASAPGLQEQQLYTEALRSVSANKNEEGRKKFNEFMAKYPNSAKTPEALYWIGESYMGDKSYNQAILSFKEVTTRYPKDPKAASALYRIADAYERLGDKANAAFNLKLLLEQHPGSEFTGKAKQKLKQLGQ